MKRDFTSAQHQEYADALEAAGIFRTWAVDEAKVILAGVTYYDLEDISAEMHRRAVVRAVATFPTTEAIRSYMNAQAATVQRGLRAPVAHNLDHIVERVCRTTDQYHKSRPAWNAKPTGLVMKLKEAVSFGHSQEAYADYSTYLVPVTGDLNKADLPVANANLSAFFRRADSHTGLAGSGANWSASLVITTAGALVVVTVRSSIAD